MFFLKGILQCFVSRLVFEFLTAVNGALSVFWRLSNERN